MLDTSILPRGFKTRLIFDYVCSVCWSQLVEQGYDGPIVCNVTPDHRGFVTRRYADRRRQQSQFDLQVVKAIYQESDIAELLGLVQPRKSSAELQAAFARNRAVLHGSDALL